MGASCHIQAEGLVAALDMYRLTGQENYYDMFVEILDWVAAEQVDWEHGDWHALIGDDEQWGKAGPWKTPYHNGRAVLECLEILGALQPIDPAHSEKDVIGLADPS